MGSKTNWTLEDHSLADALESPTRKRSFVTARSILLLTALLTVVLIVLIGCGAETTSTTCRDYPNDYACKQCNDPEWQFNEETGHGGLVCK
jgi:hypothetical protein